MVGFLTALQFHDWRFFTPSENPALKQACHVCKRCCAISYEVYPPRVGCPD